MRWRSGCDSLNAASTRCSLAGREHPRRNGGPGADGGRRAGRGQAGSRRRSWAGDGLTHDILFKLNSMVKLNSTFVPPFDREDIQRLTVALDDVVDAVERPGRGS